LGVIGGLGGVGVGAGALVHTIEGATMIMGVLMTVGTIGTVDGGAVIAMGSMIVTGEGADMGARGE